MPTFICVMIVITLMVFLIAQVMFNTSKIMKIILKDIDGTVKIKYIAQGHKCRALNQYHTHHSPISD